MRIWAGAAIAAAALPLAGCSHVPDAVNPVAWYRDASGSDQNDSQDAGQRNQQNLEAGSKEPYPNLATVPNVPSGATGTAEREKLVHSLIADRQHAQYNSEHLQAGGQLASIAPPPPANAGLPSGSTAAPSTTAAIAPRPAPTTPVTATSAPPPPAAPQHVARPPVQQHEAPPQESTLTSPTVPIVPKGEAPPPPPPPAKVTTTAPPSTPVVASTTPSPPPPAPNVAPSPPPAAAPAGVRLTKPTLAMRSPANATNPITVSVGDIVFAQGSSDLAETQRSALDEIAGLYKQTGGQIRIVGHAEPGRTDDAMRQRIAGLDLALDRANAVAQALSKRGIPARDLRVEAAPATAAAHPRAEVFMEY